MSEQSMAPLPRRVVAGPDDVLDQFEACATSSIDGYLGWEDDDCKALSPDGAHQCWCSKDDHVHYEHWCLCDEVWPVEDRGDGDIARPVKMVIDSWTYCGVQMPVPQTVDYGLAIKQSIEHVEDPALRRVFQEEVHRNEDRT